MNSLLSTSKSKKKSKMRQNINEICVLVVVVSNIWWCHLQKQKWHKLKVCISYFRSAGHSMMKQNASIWSDINWKPQDCGSWQDNKQGRCPCLCPCLCSYNTRGFVAKALALQTSDAECQQCIYSLEFLPPVVI